MAPRARARRRPRGGRRSARARGAGHDRDRAAAGIGPRVRGRPVPGDALVGGSLPPGLAPAPLGSAHQRDRRRPNLQGGLAPLGRALRAGGNRVLRAAGWRGPLDRETFAALAYNWGKAPQAFAQAADLRTVAIPASTASYALRFSQALRQARARPGETLATARRRAPAGSKLAEPLTAPAPLSTAAAARWGPTKPSLRGRP